MARPILISFLLAFCHDTFSHPIPDIPVRAFFSQDGVVNIRVEVDSRCFAKDPLNEPYLENAVLQAYNQEVKERLFLQAEKLIRKSIEFWMHPVGQVLPSFKMKFTSFSNKDLTWDSENPAENTTECAEMPVVITAEWETDASRLSGYQIKATNEGEFSVYFINDLNGEDQPLNVLFPGEASYVLDLTPWASAVIAKPQAVSAEVKKKIISVVD